VDRANNLQDSAKILYQPGWIQPATVFEFLINQERWDSLGPERQSLIERTCGEMLQRTLSDSANLQAAALTAFTNQDRVRILNLPDDVQGALRKVWDQVAQEEGVRDYLFKEVLDDIEAFRSGGIDEEDAEATAIDPEAQKAEEAIPPPPPPGDATPVGP
jgi:TRAP-type mannitol/chloroaromatic compound transport system substrate-binding protein